MTQACQEMCDERAGHRAVERHSARQLDIGPESLRSWVRQAQVNGGLRPGPSSGEAARIKESAWENRELRRANEILKSAARFFTAELDRPSAR